MYEEECEGHYLEFDYPEGYGGLKAGDSLTIAVELAIEDPTYERASFWIGANEKDYVGRARKVAAP